MEGLIESQGADIDENDFGKILGQAFDVQGAKAVL